MSRNAFPGHSFAGQVHLSAFGFWTAVVCQKSRRLRLIESTSAGIESKQQPPSSAEVGRTCPATPAATVRRVAIPERARGAVPRPRRGFHLGRRAGLLVGIRQHASSLSTGVQSGSTRPFCRYLPGISSNCRPISCRRNPSRRSCPEHTFLHSRLWCYRMRLNPALEQSSFPGAERFAGGSGWGVGAWSYWRIRDGYGSR